MNINFNTYFMTTDSDLDEIQHYDIKDCEIEIEDIEERSFDLKFRLGNCTSSTLKRELQNEYLDLMEKKRKIHEQYRKLTNKSYDYGQRRW